MSRGSALPGSSPHTRGAPAVEAGWDSAERIIPAYAGSTRRSRRRVGRPADHPRIRGEHDLRPRLIGQTAGSSPHTRGALANVKAYYNPNRIIPAYAGSTVDCVVVGFPEWDHPRIRGEHG